MPRELCRHGLHRAELIFDVKPTYETIPVKFQISTGESTFILSTQAGWYQFDIYNSIHECITPTADSQSRRNPIGALFTIERNEKRNSLRHHLGVSNCRLEEQRMKQAITNVDEWILEREQKEKHSDNKLRSLF